VLIKGGVHLENLAAVRAVALDKTGTLTAGRPRVTAVHPVSGVSDTELLAAAAAVEARSEHPLARAVRAAATDAGVTVRDPGEFTALPGAGARAIVEGRDIVVGSPALLRERDVDIDPVAPLVTTLQGEGATAVLVAADGRLLGVLGIADTVRPGAGDALAALRRLGIDRVVMLTGDNARTAAVVARAVGADDYRADLRPADKANQVAALQADVGHVAFVGDGVNDAPALAAAQVGIAMGAAGSDVALETADVALMSDDLARLTDALRIGRRTRRIVRQNITLSLLILAALVPGALLGVFTLPVAVLAHEISELLVISNGLRAAQS
jgi:Cd2+/Zn2+-exporting ATPase